MPSSSVDTFLACSVMVILALSAIVGTSKVTTPYLNDLSGRDDTERFQQLASHVMLSTGNPSNWGQLGKTVPSSLGLARADSSEEYELDIDKVTRLNSRNIYSLTYAQLWEALGTTDVAFQLEVRTLFEVSINSASNSTQGDQTSYEFEITAKKSGMPISAELHGYVAVGNFVNETTSSTSASGVRSLTVNIPNSISGAALFLVIARTETNPHIVSFSTYSFGHNSQTPLPNGTFMGLSPLAHVLNASFVSPATEIMRANIFTFNYNFSLAEKAAGVQHKEYSIPRILDTSPILMVLTGNNASTSFADWVAYPQLPLQIGMDFSQSTAGSKIITQRHVVTINQALYEVVTKWGGTG